MREIFIRINAQGTPLASADRAFARAASLDLRNKVRALQDVLKNDFSRLREEPILMAAALLLGSRDIGDRAIDAMVRHAEKTPSGRQAFEGVWKNLRKAVPYAVDYIVSEFGIPDYSAMPSDYLVTLLSVFFYHRRSHRPSRAQKHLLRKWFWMTIVGSRFTGRGYRPNILADARMMELLASGRRAGLAVPERQPLRLLYGADYRRRGMVTQGFFALLRLHQPRFLEDGERIPTVDLSSSANRQDKHHIFPKGLLKKYGVSSSSVNSLANICFLVARENQSVGARLPRSYLDDIPDGRRHVRATLRSHLIPDDEGSGLRERHAKRGFRKFLKARAWLIAKSFERQAGGTRLFERE